MVEAEWTEREGDGSNPRGRASVSEPAHEQVCGKTGQDECGEKNLVVGDDRMHARPGKRRRGKSRKDHRIRIRERGGKRIENVRVEQVPWIVPSWCCTQAIRHMEKIGSPRSGTAYKSAAC
jgi:hypothetical protein